MLDNFVLVTIVTMVVFFLFLFFSVTKLFYFIF